MCIVYMYICIVYMYRTQGKRQQFQRFGIILHQYKLFQPHYIIFLRHCIDTIDIYFTVKF